MTKRCPRIKSGIPKLDKALGEVADAIDYLLKLQGTDPVRVSETPNGPVVSYAPPLAFWAVITGNSGSGEYTFDQVDSVVGGVWDTAINGRSGSAFEYSLNASVTVGVYVWVEHFPAVDEYRFQRGTC